MQALPQILGIVGLHTCRQVIGVLSEQYNYNDGHHTGDQRVSMTPVVAQALHFELYSRTCAKWRRAARASFHKHRIVGLLSI